MSIRKFVSSDKAARRGRLDQFANMEISSAFLAFLGSIFGTFHRYFDQTTCKFKTDEFKAAQKPNVQSVLRIVGLLCFHPADAPLC